MKSNIQDTFLLSHARRMRNYRKRQQQQDPEAYKIRVNTQQTKYRLSNLSTILSDRKTKQILESIVTTRTANRERQRRYRLNLSREKTIQRQEKDRNYRRLKRQQQKVDQSNEGVNNHVSPPSTVFKNRINSESKETFFYTFSLKSDSLAFNE
ncbi:unnamed protein product [Adineta steineri]|uniref:Uncharacterized protein n=1 Tax=Adineta steineri TaxID=433720 RepID=A0A815TUZ7_9BILA|nr:unnamed protein product [Adineta steineri]CAF4104767.1 unnamed protein product [Adineta steineri]